MTKPRTKKKPEPEPGISSNMPRYPVRIHCKFDEMIECGALTAHPLNPNTHPENQIEILSRVIAGSADSKGKRTNGQGWRSPIVVSHRSGYIVAGHGRLLAARHAGLTHVPVEYQDFASDEEEWSHLVADNRIAELAEIGGDALRQIMEQLNQSDAGIDLTGFDEEAFKKLLEEGVVTAPESFPVFDETLPTEHQCPKCSYKWSGQSAVAK